MDVIIIQLLTKIKEIKIEDEYNFDVCIQIKSGFIQQTLFCISSSTK